MDIECKIKELKEIYPEVVSIVTTWQVIAQTHGHVQTPTEKTVLEKYVNILKDLGVLDNET